MAALSIGISVGDIVDIGDASFTIIARKSSSELVVADDLGQQVTLSSLYELELLPDVWVKFWMSKGLRALRLRIVADERIPISRRKKSDISRG